jgi:hypothetical protein
MHINFILKRHWVKTRCHYALIFRLRKDYIFKKISAIWRNLKFTCAIPVLEGVEAGFCCITLAELKLAL